VAVIGYGSQGHAIAQNLQDSGFAVTVGLASRSRSRARAKKDGIRQITTIARAVRASDVIAFAFPDHEHGRTFVREIEPNLRQGMILWFLHGLSVHFGLVSPPNSCDVIMVAPHAPGPAVRENFLSGQAFSAFGCVHSAISDRAREVMIELASGIGVPRDRLVETSFAEEAIGDLFGEQVVLCGGLAMLIKSGFEVLLEKGHDPDRAYLEVAYQLDLIIRLIKRYGIEGMFARISRAAQVGSLDTGPEIIDEAVKERMRGVYEHIASGAFARDLAAMTEGGRDSLADALKALSHPDFEKASRKFAD
jgi:ketol-acid reductoisomerase